MRWMIVTGGSRGLGAALCDVYRAQGWRVVEFSRSAPFAHSIRLDLADHTRAAEVFAELFARVAADSPDEVVAIGNAAVLGPVGPVTQASPGRIAEHLTTNVTSGVLFPRAFAAACQDLACPKTFVNITSGAAVKAHAGWSLYSASKAALEGFVRAFAAEQEGRAHPIRAISVNPGVMDTAMQEAVRASSVADFPELERFVGLYEDGLLAPPSSVAARVAEIVAARPPAGGVYVRPPR